MQSFSELPFHKQLMVLAGMITVLGVPAGSALLWAADEKINETYATDEDLRSVQQTLSAQVAKLSATVQANTETNAATTKSVDGLTLVVLDLKRQEIADEIYTLELEKRNQGANWNQTEESELRDKQQALQDLNTQRSSLFARVISQQ